jgi:hypothetical protein
MQNEVFNRRLFQRKDGARTRLNQLARADQPSGILASSQPLIDEAMKSVRRPETSAIPMDVAKGMSAGRAGGMPMAPAPMPMPMAPPPAPAPMPMAPPSQQMAQAPQPQPNLNPMRPGVRTMQEGGETTPMGPMESGEEAITRNMSDIDISDLAGTVLQAIRIIDDPDIKPKPTLQGLVAVAGGDPDVKDIKGAAAKAAKEFKLSKINTKDSIPKIVKQIRGDLGKMAESTEFFGMAADKDPRAASAFGRAMSKAQGTQMALEADKQKTAAANAEAERLLRLKAELTPRTGAGGAFSKADGYTDTVTRMTVEIMKTQDLPYNEALAFAQQHAQSIGLTPGGSNVQKTPEQLIADAKEAIEQGAPVEAVRERLVKQGIPAESV